MNYEMGFDLKRSPAIAGVRILLLGVRNRGVNPQKNTVIH